MYIDNEDKLTKFKNRFIVSMFVPFIEVLLLTIREIRRVLSFRTLVMIIKSLLYMK